MDERRIAPALVLRLKLMAGLDISEKRLPQDGRFSLRVKERTVDVRVSTMPVQHGESVVLRLLDQSSGLFRLDQLGMSLDLRRRVEHVRSRPHGMVLVTGPTGSGKTTTLYAAINLLNRPERKIITVEDPVEYRLERINQVQVRADIGLSFARVLRSVLRQDPDVVLVGEMRDEETVEIGLRAAMTGHLVLSTLHTNDAVSTVNRLLDMNAKGYLVASALAAVIAQRLVRRVCASCVSPSQPADHARQHAELHDDHHGAEEGRREAQGLGRVVERRRDGGDGVGLERAHVALPVEIDWIARAGGDVLRHESDDRLVGVKQSLALLNERPSDQQGQCEAEHGEHGVESAQPMPMPGRVAGPRTVIGSRPEPGRGLAGRRARRRGGGLGWKEGLVVRIGAGHGIPPDRPRPYESLPLLRIAMMSQPARNSAAA